MVFITQVEQDKELSKIHQAIRRGYLPNKIFYQMGVLLYKQRLVLPSNSLTIPLIPSEFHINLVGGHNGATEMYQQLKKELFGAG